MIKRIVSIIIAAALLIPASAQSKVQKCSMQSAVLGVEKEYVVYLPSDYDPEGDRTYPVLYLLHGLGGCCTTWTENYDLKSIADRRIKSGFSVPMIIVMPDAGGVLENHKGDNVGYVNREGWRYEDYFFEELIPEIESRFRAAPGFRAVSGLSMGGSASVIYAMHRPECFVCSCPMSSRVEGTPDHAPGTGGDSEAFYAYSRDHNMVEYLRSQSPERQALIGQVRWYLDCGSSDSLLPGNMHLYELMHALRFPCAELRVREGSHKADYWRTSLPEVMTFVSVAFALGVE